MLNWASRFGIFLFLDSNHYADPRGRYECLLAAGATRLIRTESNDAFAAIDTCLQQDRDWLFGHLCYDLKNALEPRLHSAHPPRHHWPDLQFFIPEVVCLIPRGQSELRIESLKTSPDLFAAQILQQEPLPQAPLPTLQLEWRLQREAYISRIETLQRHIRDGDCYEVTLCNEGFAEGVSLDPLATFQRLNANAPAPFAAYYRDGPRHLMCSSPERFLGKRANRIFSQPIKGTARRSADPAEDEQLKEALRRSEKDRAENVMIVDLVRNDLARSCRPGSVEVDELFGIYSFPRVHQMISTISGELQTGIPLTEAIRHAFPMGSMTGAPKHMAMQLIERYEAARRELYSGSVGYISPEGDFDFNVIIRSLFYQEEEGYLSCQTGGAITWDSQPEAEWEEMRLKAAAVEALFKK